MESMLLWEGNYFNREKLASHRLLMKNSFACSGVFCFSYLPPFLVDLGTLHKTCSPIFCFTPSSTGSRSFWGAWQLHVYRLYCRNSIIMKDAYVALERMFGR